MPLRSNGETKRLKIQQQKQQQQQQQYQFSSAITSTSVSNGGEWKMSLQQQQNRARQHTVINFQQQQVKDETGPISPTEASVAPIYYNNSQDSRNEYHTSNDSSILRSALSSSTIKVYSNKKSRKIPKSRNNSPSAADKMIIYTTSSPSSPSSPLPPPPPSYSSSYRSDTLHKKNSSHCNNSQNNIIKYDTSATPAEMNSIFRDRSVEETEAAHDLLSLSQSLPPLLAPCVVTILHPEMNYNPHSPVMQEISPNYETYTQKQPYSQPKSFARQMKKESTTVVAAAQHTSKQPLMQKNLDKTNKLKQSSHALNYEESNRDSVASPLTPPASESSSDAEQSSSYYSESSTKNHRVVTKRKKSKKSPSTKSTRSRSSGSSDSKVYAMTIFDSVMINDGRTKKGNGEAEIIHVEEKRLGRYKCSQCGKQYATSSNLSRHKQTHRSLDSQSAKKCHTCGKAYVSMPALAMHLLTHKLTHSCGVCGKLFSRPWLLQGHLRSHTGEKPYGCAHCGKAFADRSNLRAHMQTHSINKQYECTRCHKSFALKSYLNKHLESSCLRDEFKKFYDGEQPIDDEDDDDYDEDEDIIVE